MHSSLSNRSLFRGMLAAALVLASASACSRSDKASDGTSQTGAATTTAADSQAATTSQAPANAATAAQDTQDTPAEPKPGVSGYQPMAGDNTSDTAAAGDVSESATDTVAVGDSAQVGKPGERLEGSDTSRQASDDSPATQPEADPIRPPEDSSETVGTVTTTDSAAVASAPMARDTAADLGQVDTSVSQQASADTGAIQVQVDTATAEPETDVALDVQTDTTAVAGDSAEVGKRVRPPEDSTELLGRNAEGVEQDADIHADADVQAHADVQADADLEGVGDANAESVGAARVETTGGMVTGAAAVSAMTREGQRCTVVDPEQSPELARDMASSPATLNPCGTGTMTLPWIWTGER